jgi:HD superfamily phosphohydrolase
MMFQHLIDENGLMEEMEKYGLGDDDVTFIKELIAGPISSDVVSSQDGSEWPYKGRPQSKRFLFEIVANKKTGIDVDKWDYFARDCHCLGVPNSFDLNRYMKFARVIQVEGKWQICTRDKEVSNLYEMFHTRSTLHRRAYQHKTSNIIELMITEALVAANDYLMIPGRDNKLLKMSEAIWDPFAFTKLTDQVLQQIQLTPDPNLKQAKEILERVERRQLYKYIGQTQPASPTTVITKDDIARITAEMIGCLADIDLDDLPVLHEEDMLVMIATFDYGMKDQNPIDHMRFYTKDNLQTAIPVRKDQVSQMLPQTFREQQIRVFCRKVDKPSLHAAWKYFITWCNKQNCITPKGVAMHMDSPEIGANDTAPYNSPYATPLKQDMPVEPIQSHNTPMPDSDVVKKLKFELK